MSAPASSSSPLREPPRDLGEPLRALPPRIIDLGRLSYAAAYTLQLAHHEEVLAARDTGTADPGRILLVEHDPPVITISRRAGARTHLLATPEQLAAAGVELAETDRGGDITYHGPGQLIAYPILDLNHYHLGLHAYMRLLEQAIIDTLAKWGIASERDPKATGVWVKPMSDVGFGMSDVKGSRPSALSLHPTSHVPHPTSSTVGSSKIAALGVRVRRWVSMHGLALNVTTNLDHFNLIVPCGLTGRSVTSMNAELGPRCPSMEEVKRALAASLIEQLNHAAAAYIENARP